MSEPPALVVPLPHGKVSLRITPNCIELRKLAQHRHWLFWKRWRFTTLSSVPYSIKVGDTTTLTQRSTKRGPQFIVTVNRRIILTSGPRERH